MMNYASPMVDDRRRAPAPAPAEPFGERLQQIAIRTADIVIAVVALIVLAPLLALVALIVYLSDRGPVIFAHQRLGRDGRSFGCLKFRSMVTDAQERLRHLLETDAEARAEWARDHKLRNDPRITPIGRFIRKTSIDELPQLWNVIRGEMSIVGPRPIVEAERALWPLFPPLRRRSPRADRAVAGERPKRCELPPSRRLRCTLCAPLFVAHQHRDHGENGAGGAAEPRHLLSASAPARWRARSFLVR